MKSSCNQTHPIINPWKTIISIQEIERKVKVCEIMNRKTECQHIPEYFLVCNDKNCRNSKMFTEEKLNFHQISSFQDFFWIFFNDLFDKVCVLFQMIFTIIRCHSHNRVGEYAESNEI